jgi:hypothetical protein
MDGSTAMSTRVERYFESRAGHARNRYVLADADRERVGKRWDEVIRRYGYNAPMPNETSSRAMS